MPGRQDKTTRVQTATGMDRPTMPEHLIGIYAEATRQFMATRPVLVR